MAGYFRALLSRPLAGPHLLRPARRLFAPVSALDGPGRDIELQEPAGSDWSPRSTTSLTQGRAITPEDEPAPVGSGDMADAITLAMKAVRQEPATVSLTAFREPRFMVRTDAPAPGATTAGAEVATPTRLLDVHGSAVDLPTNRPTGIGFAGGDNPLQPDSIPASTQTADHLADSSPKRHRMLEPPPAARPLRTRRPPQSRRNQSAPASESKPQGANYAEEPVSVEIGRVDVIVGQPDSSRTTSRTPLEPLSRGLSWAEGPPGRLA